jgi:hypothetical protein
MLQLLIIQSYRLEHDVGPVSQLIELRQQSVLWDIGTYRIDPIHGDDDSDSEGEKRKKRRRADHPTIESEDPYVTCPSVADVRLGKFEEDKFRAGFHRNPGAGKTRSIHFTLLGGKKVSPIYHRGGGG